MEGRLRGNACATFATFRVVDQKCFAGQVMYQMVQAFPHPGVLLLGQNLFNITVCDEKALVVDDFDFP